MGSDRALLGASLRRGAKVACVDLAAPEEVIRGFAAAGDKTAAFACDITRPDQAKATIDKIKGEWGAIDILVNCASADDPTANILTVHRRSGIIFSP